MRSLRVKVRHLLCQFVLVRKETHPQPKRMTKSGFVTCFLLLLLSNIYASIRRQSSYNSPQVTTNKIYDVAVVGAGVFGAWTALQLSRAGAAVVLVDAYGPGNNRASSGGESRMIRMGYGPDLIYTRMAQRSLALWQALFDRVGRGEGSAKLFQPTGILWLARDNDAYALSSLKTLEQCGVRHEQLDRVELLRRYPAIEPGDVTWAILEPDSGVLMARQAVQAVVAEARKGGVVYLNDEVVPLEFRDEGKRGTGKGERWQTISSDSDLIPQSAVTNLKSIKSAGGGEIVAKEFVFACGPWLPKIFPELLRPLINVTRQEVFFFAVPAGGRFGPEQMPAWIDFGDLIYGIPNLDNRGFKLAIDAHGPQFDPDEADRVVSREGLASARACLAKRMPELAHAVVTETRVCQYENTSNGDFVIDRHPAFENVWLAGGGSGHGFKHGPAVGEHVAALISGSAQVEPRFSLASKQRVQQRTVF